MFPAFSSDSKWIAARRGFGDGPADTAVIRSLETGKEAAFQLYRLSSQSQTRQSMTPRLDWLNNEGVLVFSNGVLYRIDPLGAVQKLSSVALSSSGPRSADPGAPFTLATSTLS